MCTFFVVKWLFFHDLKNGNSKAEFLMFHRGISFTILKAFYLLFCSEKRMKNNRPCSRLQWDQINIKMELVIHRRRWCRFFLQVPCTGTCKTTHSDDPHAHLGCLRIHVPSHTAAKKNFFSCKVKSKVKKRSQNLELEFMVVNVMIRNNAVWIDLNVKNNWNPCLTSSKIRHQNRLFWKSHFKTRFWPLWCDSFTMRESETEEWYCTDAGLSYREHGVLGASVSGPVPGAPDR